MIRRWLGLCVLVGCSNGNQINIASLAATTDTVTLTSTMHGVPELAGLMEGVMGPRIPDGIEGFRCDSTPTIATTTLCGKTYPTNIALDWTNCAAWSDHGGMPGSGFGMGGSTSGTVNITNDITIDPTGSCDDTATWTFNRASAIDIKTLRPDGSSHEIVANVTSTSERQPSAHAFSQQRNYDVRRTDSKGTTHTTGQTQEAFDDSSGSPQMTINGSLHEDRADGSSADITATNVVRGDPRACRWPTSGTIVEHKSDGTTHTLVFTTLCGHATLDGATVMLPEGRRHRDGDRDHMGGGCMNMGPDAGSTPDAIAR